MQGAQASTAWAFQKEPQPLARAAPQHRVHSPGTLGHFHFDSLEDDFVTRNQARRHSALLTAQGDTALEGSAAYGTIPSLPDALDTKFGVGANRARTNMFESLRQQVAIDARAIADAHGETMHRDCVACPSLAIGAFEQSTYYGILVHLGRLPICR